MLKILATLALGALLFSGSAALSAEEGAAKPKKTPAVSGEIVSVDVGSKTLVLKVMDKKAGTAQEKTFTATEATKVTIDGAEKALGDLAAGQHAKVAAEKDVATLIAVGEAKGGEKHEKHDHEKHEKKH